MWRADEWMWLALALLVLVLTGCGAEAPAVPPDAPVLTGLDRLPKQLATIEMTATPSPVLVGMPQPGAALSSATPAPPRPTPTLTPYVGIFLGRPTSESGEALADDIPTLAPFVVGPMGGPGVVGGLAGEAVDCPVAPAGVFVAIYAANAALQERLGCPVGIGGVEQMAAQPFERGTLYWRPNGQIYALANSGQLWQVTDTWHEGLPPDDPAFSAPAGLVQPIRGFGLVWRTNTAIRDALGWGTQSEALISGFWQDFERGAVLQGLHGQVVAIFPGEGQHSGPLTAY